MKAALGSLLVVLLGGFLGLSGEWSPPTPGLLALGAVSIYLQIIAVPQCGFGFFSSAFASLFAMLLTPGIGPRWTLLAALLGTGLRTLSKGDSRPEVRWREALADGLPGAAALAAAWACHNLSPMTSVAVGLAVYLPLSLMVPEWIALESGQVQGELWYHLREMTGYHNFAVAFLGPITAYVGQAVDWWAIFWVLPVFFALHRASRTDLLRLEAMERELLEHQAERSRQVLQQTEAQLAQASQALHTQLSSRQLSHQLAQRLSVCQQPQQVLDLLLDCLRATVASRSLIFYAAQNQQLVPMRWLSPDSERWQQAALGGVPEPLVESAWESAQLQTGQSPSAICTQEIYTLAAPISGEGVLYLGRPDPAFQPLDLELVQVVASQAALALQSVRRFADQQQTLELHRQAHHQLQLWVERLGHLLEASRVLGSSQDEETLLDRFQQLVESLIPHAHGAILQDERLRLNWPPGWSWGEGLAVLARAVTQPLLIDDLTLTRFASSDLAARSLLGIPLSDEDGRWGVLLLGSEQSHFFTREHRDLIHLVGAQLTSALRGSAMREQIRSSQAQLAQSSKMAAVGQLAAGIAHELNTPLAAVTLQLDSALMRLEKRPELVPEKLATAQKAIQKVQAIIAKLLFYSRDAAIGRQSVDLNEVVSDTLELIHRQIEIDEVHLESQLGPVPKILGNANELQQVLTNLLLNARDAALLGTSHLIRLKTSSQPGWVLLQVEDDGPGIAADIVDKIFDPFFTTKPVGHGTGLGLSLSQDIVRNHGGRIELDSRPGLTRFVVYLPQEASAAREV